MKLTNLFDCVNRRTKSYLCTGVECDEEGIISIKWDKRDVSYYLVDVNFGGEITKMTYDVYPYLTFKQRFLLFWVTWMDRRL